MPVAGSAAVLPQFAPPQAPGNWMWKRLSLDGVNSPSLAASRTACFSARLLLGRHERVDVVRRERLPRERLRLGRERLRRRRHLAGDLALRDRALFDRPQRLAGQRARRRRGTRSCPPARRCRRVAPVVSDGEELGRGGEVVVPEVVVHGLEVPLALAGARVEGDERVAEQVVADAIGAVEIVGGGAERHEDEPVLARRSSSRPSC